MLTEKAKGGVDPAEEVLGGEGIRMCRCTQLTPKDAVPGLEVGAAPVEWGSPGRLWVYTSAEHT